MGYRKKEVLLLEGAELSEASAAMVPYVL